MFDLEYVRVAGGEYGYSRADYHKISLGYTMCGEAKSTIVKFTLYEGRNREIRNICAHHGLKLARLIRTSVGDLTLFGLNSGSWRYLTDDEVEYLKNL